MRRTVLAVAAAAAVVAGWAGPAGASSPDVARPVSATVGPVFRTPVPVVHDCTASVVASRTHDLIMTAAHCVYGLALGWTFAPGYDAGQFPFGVWTVTATFVDPAWQQRQDPHHDVAILRVARHGGQGIQDVVGANHVAPAPRSGRSVLVIAYNAGAGDRAIRCRTQVYYTAGFPSFDCPGFAGGSSGGPWLARAAGRTVVRGLIGGLHQGGCTADTSYSPRFGHQVRALLARATAGGHGDLAPVPGSDGC